MEYGNIDPESLNRMISGLRREAVVHVPEKLAELKEANRVAASGESVTLIRVGEAKKKAKFKGDDRFIEVGGHQTSVDPLDEGDLIFYGTDNKMHAHEVKNTASALVQSIRDKPQQMEKLLEWRESHLSEHGIEGEIAYVVNTSRRWGQLFSEETPGKDITIIGVLAKEKIPLIIDGQRWDVDKLQNIDGVYKRLDNSGETPKWIFNSNDLSDADKLLRM